MKRQEEAGSVTKRPTSWPSTTRCWTAGSLYGGPCLSFLSFKLHPENGLMLTAMYRNHTYITRCLGNLIGLGRLQAFVAKEAGVKLGSLTSSRPTPKMDTGETGGSRTRRELVEPAPMRLFCRVKLKRGRLRGWRGQVEESQTLKRRGSLATSHAADAPLPDLGRSSRRRSTTRTGGSRPSARTCSSAGSKAPAAVDARPGLRAHKFTNAYRASDRVSQYLIRRVIYRADLPDDPDRGVSSASCCSSCSTRSRPGSCWRSNSAR